MRSRGVDHGGRVGVGLHVDVEAVLPGRGRDRPRLELGHLDVAPAELHQHLAQEAGAMIDGEQQGCLAHRVGRTRRSLDRHFHEAGGVWQPAPGHPP